MVWTFLGAVASVIGIFGFITGFTSLPQILRVWRGRRRTSITILPGTPATEWRRTIARAKMLMTLIIASVVGGAAASRIPPDLAVTIYGGADISEFRALVGTILVAGGAYPILVLLLRRRYLLDRDEAAMLLCLPLGGAAALFVIGILGRSLIAVVAVWFVASAASVFIVVTLTTIEIAFNYRHRNEI